MFNWWGLPHINYMPDGVIQPEISVNQPKIIKGAMFGEKKGTPLEQKVAGTLRAKAEAGGRVAIAKARTELRNTPYSAAKVTELQARFTTDAPPTPDGTGLDVAAKNITDLYDRYIQDGYTGLTNPADQAEIDKMITHALENQGLSGSRFDRLQNPARIRQIAEDPRTKLHIKREMANMAKDEAFIKAQTDYNEAVAKGRPQKDIDAKKAIYVEQQTQNFGKLQSLMIEGAETYVDGQVEIVLKDAQKTLDTEYKRIQNDETTSLYKNLREAQRTNGKLDKKKVNQHWRDMVDNGPEDILKSMGYTDADQIQRLSPHITKMVIDRKMNRTFWAPSKGQIRDFMETPWGQQLARDGERTKAMQELMDKADFGDGVVNFITGKGKGWKGRTPGLALAVLATAAANALTNRDEERVAA